MVAELLATSPTVMMQPSDDASCEDRCQQIDARLGIVHSHHQLVQKRLGTQVEALERKAEEKTKAKAAEDDEYAAVKTEA